MDDFDNSTVTNATEVCGGSGSQYTSCIIDYLLTGDEEFAMETLATNQQIKDEKSILGKNRILFLHFSHFSLKIFTPMKDVRKMWEFQKKK